MPDGAFPLECRMRARSFGSRTGLVTRAGNSECGTFVRKGRPSLFICLDNRYTEIIGEGFKLHTSRASLLMAG
jgi:hypothetical protein